MAQGFEAPITVVFCREKRDALRIYEDWQREGRPCTLDGPHIGLKGWLVVPLGQTLCASRLHVGSEILSCTLLKGHGGGARHEQREPWGRYRWDRHGNVSVVFTTNNAGLEAAERKRRRQYRAKPDRRGR